MFLLLCCSKPRAQWIEISEWSVSTPQHPHLQKEAADEDVVVEGKDPQVSVNRAVPVHPDVGKALSEVDTPAVWVDVAAMERNVRLLQSRLGSVRWLPVVKAHKSLGLAQQLVDWGAAGVVVLTVAEAEIMAGLVASAEPLTLYVANSVTVPPKLTRLVQLAARHRQHRFRVNTDCVQNAADLNNAARGAGVVLDVCVELNIGHNRTGVTPAEAVALAKLVLTKPNLRFVGIAGYEGHTPVLPPPEKAVATRRAHAVLAEARALLEAAGIAVDVVSGGGSSNYPQALAEKVINELQAGGVALCDKLYLTQAHLEQHGHEPALFVETTVVSVQQEPSRGAADAGFKSVGWHPFAGVPLIVDANRSCTDVSGLSAEHLRLRPLPHCRLNIALHDRLRVIPGYGDSFLGTVKQIFAVQNGTVTKVWTVGK